MFEFNVNQDSAGNTHVSLPSHVVHYTFMFFEFGLYSKVKEHETTHESFREDIVVMDANLKAHTKSYF